MLEDSTLDNGYGSGLHLDTTDATNLRKAGKWARFIGLTLLIFMGLALVAILAFSSSALMALGLTDVGAMGTVPLLMILIIYGGILALGAYIVYLQYKFGSQAMQAVDHNDSVALSEALGALGRHYKIYGVLLVIYLAFIALGFLITVLTGATALLG